MKRTVYLFLALALVTGGYFLLKKNKNFTGKTDPHAFALKDVSGVNRIFFSKNSDRQSLLLEKQPDGTWLVNKTYPANVQKITDFLDFAVKKPEIKAPVGETDRASISDYLAKTAVKCELYVNGKVAKTYYVGGPTTDMTGTYMHIEGGETPYIVHIPGWNGYLTEWYLNENKDWAKDWRSRKIFDLKPEEIREVKLDWDEPAKSFAITSDGKDASFKSNASVVPNMQKVRSYLALFQNIQFEGWPELKKEKIDSILQSKPFVTFSVKNNKGSETVLDMYHKPVNSESYNVIDPATGQLLPYEQDYFWARIRGTNEVVQVQNYTFEKRLKTAADFGK